MSLIQAPAGCADSWSGLLWFSPAVAPSALRLARLQHWLVLLCAYWLTCTLVLLGFGKSLGAALIGPVNNVVEVILIAWLLWPDREWVDGRSDRLGSWLRFGLWGLVVAPLVGAVLGVLLVVPLTLPAPVLARTILTWYTTDVLALAVIVPLILRLRTASASPAARRRPRPAGDRSRRVDRAGGADLLRGLVPGAVPGPAAIGLLLFRSGFAGLSVGMAVQVVISLALTAAGPRTVPCRARSGPEWALLSCQVFLICVFWLMVMVAALLDERQRPGDGDGELRHLRMGGPALRRPGDGPRARWMAVVLPPDRR